jgi:nucleoid DNA-binding protein
MATTSKKDLIDRIAENNGSKHVSVKTVVQQFLDEVICERTKDNRQGFRGFGVFETRPVRPESRRIPRHGKGFRYRLNAT